MANITIKGTTSIALSQLAAGDFFKYNGRAYAKGWNSANCVEFGDVDCCRVRLLVTGKLTWIPSRTLIIRLRLLSAEFEEVL